MKVSEAKEKVCPFMSTGFAADTYTLSDGMSAIKIKCICNDCMAWEYIDDCDDNYNELPEDEKTGYCRRLENE